MSHVSHLIASAIFVLVPMILSLTVHEFAHAWTARRFGDDTAQVAGRLTLNPLVHIDLFGTIILPLVLLAVGAPFFGWAKPVPVNPTRFRRDVRPRTAMMLVAAAGPASNLVLGVAAEAVVAVLYHHGMATQLVALTSFASQMVVINLALCVFNLIPVYPLDGQKVLTGLLPPAGAIRFERFARRYGTLLLLGIIFFAGEIIAAPLGLLLHGVRAVFGMA